MADISFGDWVRGNRKRRGWSQARLARETSMDAGHVSKIENSVIGLPEPETRRRFHDAFGTTEEELISFGIVPQFDDWGRRVDVTVHGGTATATGGAVSGTVHVMESRPVYDDVNPFARDDPRWQYVETLKRFNPKDEYDHFVLMAAAKVLQLIDGDRALLADPLAGMKVPKS